MHRCDDSAIQRFNASMFSRLFGQMPVEKSIVHDYVQPDMLEDRVYMRRPSFRPRLSATVLLIIANVVAFFVQSLLYASSSRFRIDDYLPLSLDGLKHGYLWQLLTFQFMHGGLFHLLFNCIAIFVFGRDVEEALGRKPFLTLYFSSGVIGGLVQILAGLLLHGPFAERVVGASAGAFGLVAAFALLFPDRILLLFFIIPIRAKYLLLLSVGAYGFFISLDLFTLFFFLEVSVIPKFLLVGVWGAAGSNDGPSAGTPRASKVSSSAKAIP